MIYLQLWIYNGLYLKLLITFLQGMCWSKFKNWLSSDKLNRSRL